MPGYAHASSRVTTSIIIYVSGALELSPIVVLHQDTFGIPKAQLCPPRRSPKSCPLPAQLCPMQVLLWTPRLHYSGAEGIQ